jgi:hypothetical protein
VRRRLFALKLMQEMTDARFGTNNEPSGIWHLTSSIGHDDHGAVATPVNVTAPYSKSNDAPFVFSKRVLSERFFICISSSNS